MTEDRGDIHLTVTLREWTKLVIATEKQQAYHSEHQTGVPLLAAYHWEKEQAYAALAQKLRKQHAEGDS